MITKTEAVVLRSMRFRDTSRIVTFYTKSFGKLKAIAKGARDLKNKFGAALQPMTHVDLVMYKKENRDLQLVSQCDIRIPFKRIHSEIERMSVGLAMVELMDKVTHEEEQHDGVFSLLTNCLALLDKSEGDLGPLFHAFELRLAVEFGFGPSLDRCHSCGKSIRLFASEDLIIFHPTKGGFLCSDCSQNPDKRMAGDARMRSGHRTTIETIRTLHLFLTETLDRIPLISYDEPLGNEIDETLRLYLRQHFEGLKPLKSTEIFHKLLV